MADTSWLSGFQIGANLALRAKDMQLQREQQRMQAQQILQQIEASRALDAYRQQQIELARAEEERNQQRFTQEQQLFPQKRALAESEAKAAQFELEQQQGLQKFVGEQPQRRVEFMQQRFPDAEFIPEEERKTAIDEFQRQDLTEQVRRFGTPAQAASMVGGMMTTERRRIPRLPPTLTPYVVDGKEILLTPNGAVVKLDDLSVSDKSRIKISEQQLLKMQGDPMYGPDEYDAAYAEHLRLLESFGDRKQKASATEDTESALTEQPKKSQFKLIRTRAK